MDSAELGRDAASVPAGNGGDDLPPLRKRRRERKYGVAKFINLNAIDGRTVVAKEARRLIRVLMNEAGDPTVAQQQLITRAALLGAMVADFEARWVAGQEIDLPDYLASVNTQRRVLQTLGLERRTKDIGPTLGDALTADIIRQQRENIERAERQRLAFEQQQRGTAVSASTTSLYDIVEAEHG